MVWTCGIASRAYKMVMMNKWQGLGGKTKWGETHRREQEKDAQTQDCTEEEENGGGFVTGWPTPVETLTYDDGKEPSHNCYDLTFPQYCF